MDVDRISYEAQDFTVFIFMLSDSSQKSRYACGELFLAQKKNKSIYLVNINQCELLDKFTMLYSQQNLCDYSVESERKKLFINICSSLNIESPYETILHPISIGPLYGLADDEDNIIVKGTWLKINEF